MVVNRYGGIEMNRRLRPIGLLADPDELDRHLNQRQPLGFLDCPAVTVQSNNPTRRRKHVATKPKGE